MKKFNTKTSTKIVAIILAAVAACSVMGCSVEKTITITETHTDADGNTITTTQTTDKNGNVKNGTMEIEVGSAENTELADKNKATVSAFNDEELPENPGSFDTDEWSIIYDTDMWYGYVTDEGSTIINYTGECAGTSLIEISVVDVPTAKDAIAMIEDKTGVELTVIDDNQMGDEYSCYAYEANKEYKPDTLYIDDFYSIYEHNGKVIIINEDITHDFDDSRAEALAEKFLEVKNAFVLK